VRGYCNMIAFPRHTMPGKVDRSRLCITPWEDGQGEEVVIGGVSI
jgi:hypothetical protein